MNTGFCVEDAAIRQVDLGSNIGGYFDFKEDPILCIMPSAFNGSHWRIPFGLGKHKCFGGFGSNGQFPFAQANSTDIPEEPSGYGAVGIVIQRIMNGSVLPHPVPAFPNGGSAVLYGI